MRTLREKLDRTQHADMETIHHLFTADNVDTELKHFIVDEAIKRVANFETRRLGFYPTSFINLALQRTIRNLSLLNPPKDRLGRLKHESRYSSQHHFSGDRIDSRTQPLIQLKERLAEIAEVRRLEQLRIELAVEGIDAIGWAVRKVPEDEGQRRDGLQRNDCDSTAFNATNISVKSGKERTELPLEVESRTNPKEKRASATTRTIKSTAASAIKVEIRRPLDFESMDEAFEELFDSKTRSPTPKPYM
jgi:hypothetical protein